MIPDEVVKLKKWIMEKCGNTNPCQIRGYMIFFFLKLPFPVSKEKYLEEGRLALASE